MDDTLRSLLLELERFGKENDTQAARSQDRMRNITPETGELLGILVRGMRAARVLEIGTSNGYSTLWLAEAVAALQGGQIVTVEISPERAEMARQNFERSGLSRWIRQEIADAGSFLQAQAPASVDLLFLDSNRGQYEAWWPLLQSVLAPGGLLVVDNAVSHPHEMQGFLDLVRSAPGWRSVVVPIGKGELLALKDRLGTQPPSSAR